MTDDVRLRSPHPGDLGWIVHRNGVLYAREQGWNERLEAQAARAVAEFVVDPDERKRCFIAERNGEIVGSVIVMRHEKFEAGDVARLRFLLVEPAARGQGLGRRLVAECIRFVREASYRKILLVTDRHLETARRIYTGLGFRLVGSEPNAKYGPDCVSETWEAEL